MDFFFWPPFCWLPSSTIPRSKLTTHTRKYHVWKHSEGCCRQGSRPG
jgi:hypothetical protein